MDPVYGLRPFAFLQKLLRSLPLLASLPQPPTGQGLLLGTQIYVVILNLASAGLSVAHLNYLEHPFGWYPGYTSVIHFLLKLLLGPQVSLQWAC